MSGEFRSLSNIGYRVQLVLDAELAVEFPEFFSPPLRAVGNQNEGSYSDAARSRGRDGCRVVRRSVERRNAARR
jgi:hypothetical protein